MAADSLMVLNDVNIARSIKIERRDGHLVGMRGADCPAMAEAMDWLFAKTRGVHQYRKGYLKPFRFWDDRPGRDDAVCSFSLLMVDPKGCVFQIDQAGGIEPIPGGYHAIGSGEQYALAVMDHDAKAGAIAAVRAGIKRSAYCRAPIHWFGLNGKSGEVQE